jgi:hypothetical protein
LSETVPKISEEEDEIEEPSPRKSEVINPGHYSSVQLGSRQASSKLDELYYLSRGQYSASKEEARTQISQI